MFHTFHMLHMMLFLTFVAKPAKPEESLVAWKADEQEVNHAVIITEV